MQKFGVYILKSLKNASYYIGSTNDIERRLLQHNSGLTYTTKKLRPLILMRFISCNSAREAKQFEYKLKKYKRKDIVEKVVIDGVFPWNY